MKFNKPKDIIKLHGLIGNPNPYYPKITEKSIKKILKYSHNNLPITSAKFPKEFTWIKKRVSSRKFGSKEIPLVLINKLLNIGYGITKINKNYHNVRHRTVPSAGAIYPIIPTYFSFKNRKIYAYNGNRLKLMRRIKFDFNAFLNMGISKGAENIIDFENATGLISLFGELKHICSKYGPRGYFFTIIEAGHIMQNISLAAIRYNIGICELGCIVDNEILNIMKWHNSLKIHIVSAVIGSYSL